jgi:methylmalonyl-CoA mutase N-terminal domain/subunit
VTVQALAAVLGGTQSLHTNGYDEALTLPSAEAATLALRTQQILAYESGITSAVDPLGGSYYVEALTDRVEREARALIAEVDELGGAAAAIEKGFFQKAIAESAWIQQQRQEAGEQVVVGVNRFTDNPTVPVLPGPDFSALAARQIAALQAAKAGRDGGVVAARLGVLALAAAGTEPLMPPIIEAVRARATLGEISDVLRKAWGTYRG